MKSLCPDREIVTNKNISILVLNTNLNYNTAKVSLAIVPKLLVSKWHYICNFYLDWRKVKYMF